MTDLTVIEAPQSVSESFTSMLHEQVKIANVVKELITTKKMYCTITGNNYVKAEGYQAICAMLNYSVMEQYVKETKEGCFEAVAEIFDSKGNLVGRASGFCGTDEPMFKARSEHARRSQAVTRACARAAKIRFGYLVKIAGFEATPAEEMPEPDKTNHLQHALNERK